MLFSGDKQSNFNKSELLSAYVSKRFVRFLNFIDPTLHSAIKYIVSSNQYIMNVHVRDIHIPRDQRGGEGGRFTKKTVGLGTTQNIF